MHTRKSLAQDLRRLGLEAGQIVMLHASVRAVGPVIGGLDEIHLAVADAVGASGTVMMFVGCQEGFDDVGRGLLSPEEEAAILAHQPAFDFQHSRAARAFGTLAELFRSYPGTICSRGICGRMAVRGCRADWLIADQPWNYGLGRGSPLDKLCQAGGKVLLIGSDRDEVTLLHYAEHIAPFADKRVARYKVPVLREGKRTWLDCEEFDTSGKGVHPNWPPKAFASIVDDFISKSGGIPNCSVGRVGLAESVLIDAQGLVSHALPIMIAWARDASLGERAP
ncbi:MAG: AAC(3) family N-acetyltransferase [Hyphomicrobiaceae bacterium]|nr:AAC(3) family N-acetyltransferase [Hyphomicrobiaceae bacterium]